MYRYTVYYTKQDGTQHTMTVEHLKFADDWDLFDYVSQQVGEHVDVNGFDEVEI